ncbi:hypothetical protein HPB47_012915, partial [Ixodes persulcatus]
KGELKDVAELLEEFPGFLGLCLPSACTVKSLKAVGKGALFLLRTLGAKPPNVKLGIEVVDCVTKDSLKSHEQSATVLAALIVVGILMVLVLLGTLADTAFLLLVDRELSSRDLPKLQSFDIMSQNSYVETLRCFSAYRNFRLLMSGRHPSKTLRPLVGISSMSFLWVVIGNTLVLRPYNLSANLKSLREYLNDPMIQFALNSSLAMDAIATALGIMITYNIVQLVKRCDGFEKCRALTYIKCTLNASKYFFAGYVIINLCHEAIMHTLHNSSHVKHAVYKHTRVYTHQVWAVPTAAPLKQRGFQRVQLVYRAAALTSQNKYIVIWLPKFALAGLGVVVAACSLTTFLINNANDLGPTALLREYRPGSRQAYHDSIAVNFYTRGGPFCIGMIVGYILALRPKMRLNRWVALSGWLIALGAILAITHTPWFWNKEGRQMSPGAGKYAAYDAFHRVLFSAGVSYMAVACAWGSGGVINAFLSWSGWLPISKLCFAVYILNPFLIFYFNGTTRGTIFYTVKLAELFSTDKRTLWSPVRTEENREPGRHCRAAAFEVEIDTAENQTKALVRLLVLAADALTLLELTVLLTSEFKAPKMAQLLAMLLFLLQAEEILWNLLTSLMAAVPIHLLFESPFLRLAELLTDRDEQDGDTDSDSMDSLAKEEHIARLESRRQGLNQRCKRRRRAYATEAKRKLEARRRQHSTPAEQFPDATARFRREFVENPFGVTCAVCDRLWFAGDVSTIGGVSDEKQRETGEVPRFATVNGYKYPPVSEQLPRLNVVEERLVAPRLLVMSLRRFTWYNRDNQGQYGSHITNYPITP